MLNYSMSNFLSDPSLRFASRQAFRPFVEGIHALGRHQKQQAPGSIQEAITQFEQCVHVDPDSKLGRFYLALALSLNGPANAQQAKDEFSKVMKTDNISLRLSAKCNYALLWVSNPKAEALLAEVLVEIAGCKKDVHLDNLKRDIEALMPAIKKKTTVAPVIPNLDF